MPTNKQRRDAARRHLERQLERRQEREQRRRKLTLIGSVVGTLVILGVVLGLVFGLSGNDKSASNAAGTSTNNPAASTSPAATSAAASSASASTTPPPVPTKACAAEKGTTVTFDGITVKNATNLKVAPVSSSKVSAPATQLLCADLVVGRGAAATPTSTVNVQYVGTLVSNGTIFDSSWKNGGKPLSFPLTGVVPGFTQGIGGAGKVTPMRVGGRRLMILPPALGYGSQANGAIPANSSLVFVVDLTSVSAASS